MSRNNEMMKFANAQHCMHLRGWTWRVRTFRGRGFTIIEMLVVVSIIALLVGMLLPALGRVREGARQSACGNNLRQIWMATDGYLNAYDNCLPQVAYDSTPGDGDPGEIIGALFGGRRGTLPAFDIDQLGPRERPLNKFLSDSVNELDNEVAVFECPLDRGQTPDPASGLPVASTLYELVGTSYALNDHTLDGEDYYTLIPERTGNRAGGKMPTVTDPTRTWLVADQLIYNFQEMGDRKQRWHFNDHICNVCFVDGHVQHGVRIPHSTADVDPPDEQPDDRTQLFTRENSTTNYTFLPTATWLKDIFDPDPDNTGDLIGPWQAGDQSPGADRPIGIGGP